MKDPGLKHSIKMIKMNSNFFDCIYICMLLFLSLNFWVLIFFLMKSRITFFSSRNNCWKLLAFDNVTLRSFHEPHFKMLVCVAFCSSPIFTSSLVKSVNLEFFFLLFLFSFPKNYLSFANVKLYSLTFLHVREFFIKYSWLYKCFDRSIYFFNF